MSDIDVILADRGSKYGKFTDHARVTISLKAVLSQRLIERDVLIDDDQQEALHMICHKLGRIVNGDLDYADSWDDIAGYAKLVGDRLRGDSK